jgi:hypothetical protein
MTRARDDRRRNMRGAFAAERHAAAIYAPTLGRYICRPGCAECEAKK